jgi:hypothetical protein
VLRKAREARLLAARDAFLVSEEFGALLGDPGHPLAQACGEMVRRVELDGRLAGSLPDTAGETLAALEDLARRDPEYERAGAAFVEALARELVARGYWPAEMDPGPVEVEPAASAPAGPAAPASGPLPYGLKEMPLAPEGYEYVWEADENGLEVAEEEEAGPAGA